MATPKFDVTKHFLVPKHIKVSEKELKELTEKFALAPDSFPKILASDPAIEHLKAKEGDVIKIIRWSPTAGEAVYYRQVIKG
ncbi:MAG: DNA-directed RNA polymerase subunit H [Candidatus Woesearchaeota archaeon]